MRVRPGVGLAALLAVAILPPLLIVAGLLPPAAGVLGILLLATAVCWRLQRHVGALLLVFAATAFAGTVVSRPAPRLWTIGVDSAAGGVVAAEWKASGTFDESLPVVLHIVLDEMMARGAMDASLPGADETRSAIDRLASTRQLRVFDSVYSRHYYSGVSIPNMMDAGYRGLHALPDLRTEIQERPQQNAYFTDMAARGYRTAVFQSALIDFCTPSSVDVCETFPSFDPAQVPGLDERTGPMFLLDALLRALEPSALSVAGRAITRPWLGIEREALVEAGVADRYDVEAFPVWFDRFVAFIEQVPRGSLVFAHFLVPHAPYLLSDTCLPAGTRDSSYALGRRVTDRAAADALRVEYYGRYFSQVRCVVGKLDALFATLDRQPALADARVIVHGDHGARISWGRVVESGLEARDLVDNYATFFALRDPAVSPGIDCEFTSLPQLFRRVVAEGEDVGGQPPLPVLVASRAGTSVFVERPMPPFGCAAGAGSEVRP